MAKKAATLEHPALAGAWKHQRETYEFAKSLERMLDMSDAGTGKTFGQLVHYSTRPKPRGRMLVLCPKTLMRTAWGEDCEKFTPELSIAHADADSREKAFKYGTDIVTLNHDGVKWFFDSKGKPIKERIALLKDFDHLVIDEWGAFKHGTSQRTKCALKLVNLIKFTHRAGLNGTPNPISVMEFFYPVMIIDDGKRMGQSYYKLRPHLQTPNQRGPDPSHVEWVDNPGALQVVGQLLKDISIRHEFEAVMKHVPPNHREMRDFAMGKRAMKAYADMERDCILAFEDGAIANAVHAASLRSKLLQIASGAVYSHGDTDGEGSYTVIDTLRYELIADLIEETQHTVTFFNWKHQRDLLCKELDKRGMKWALIDGSTKDRDRELIVKDYQKGCFRNIFLHPRTGAHGLTLTKGDTTILASPIYEADGLVQGSKRIHRGTQDKITRTLLVRAKGTVENKVYDKLFAREANMRDMLSQFIH